MIYRIGLAGTLFLLLGLRWLTPERGHQELGLAAPLNGLFALLLAGYIVLLAGCLGFKLRRRLKLDQLSTFEELLFELVLGLGIVAYAVTVLALVGLLNQLAIVVVLSGLALLAGDSLPGLAQHAKSLSSGTRQSEIDGIQKIQVGIIVGLFGLALLQALAPAWGADSIMYHLSGPLRFLEAGRFIPLPDMWQANGPFTIDMLFTIGLAFESDVFARLMHWALGLLFVLATFALGFRVIGARRGWDAGIILLGIPILLIWFSLAYHDAGWALFELMALYALVLWRERGGAALAGAGGRHDGVCRREQVPGPGWGCGPGCVYSAAARPLIQGNRPGRPCLWGGDCSGGGGLVPEKLAAARKPGVPGLFRWLGMGRRPPRAV